MKITKEERIWFAVISIVLLASDGHWTGPKTLKTAMSVPEGLEGYVQDYGINVFELAYLTDEQLALFQSDFQFVAELFVKNRKNREGEESEFTLPIDKIVHTEELIYTLVSLTGDNSFEIIGELTEEEKEGATMETIITRRYKEGIKEGRRDGIKEGRIKDVLRVMEGLDYTARKAMDLLGIPEEERAEYLEKLQ